MALTCIFCPTALDEGTRAEHPIACAIGGRLKDRTIVCNSCNEALGEAADHPLAKGLEMTRWWLLVHQCDGADPPTLLNVPMNGKLINMPPYGPGERAAREIGELRQVGDEIHFSASAHDVDSVAEASAHQLRRAKVADLDKVKRLRVETVLTKEAYREPVQARVGFADGRGIGKAAFEFFAIHERTAAHDSRCDDVRAFARYGSPSDCTRLDYANAPTLPFDREALGPNPHALMVWGNPGHPVVCAVWILGFPFTVRICDEWWGDSFAYAHAVDPLAPANLGTREFAPPPPLSLEQLAQRTDDVDRLLADVNAMAALGRRRHGEALIRRLTETYLDPLRQRATCPTAEEFAAVGAAIDEEIHALTKDVKRPLSAEEMTETIRHKFSWLKKKHGD